MNIPPFFELCSNRADSLSSLILHVSPYGPYGPYDQIDPPRAPPNPSVLLKSKPLWTAPPGFYLCGRIFLYEVLKVRVPPFFELDETGYTLFSVPHFDVFARCTAYRSGSRFLHEKLIPLPLGRLRLWSDPF